MQNDVNELKSQVRAFIVNYVKGKYSEAGLEYGEFLDEESLTSNGLLDSMEFFGLVTDIENEFSIVLSFEDVEPDRFTTIAGILSCIMIDRNDAK